MDDINANVLVCRRKGERRRVIGNVLDTTQASFTPSSFLVDSNGQKPSSREQEILLYMAEGKTDKQIAASLRLSEKTVQHHVRNLLIKVGACNRTQAVVMAIGLRLIDPHLIDGSRGTIDNKYK